MYALGILFSSLVVTSWVGCCPAVCIGIGGGTAQGGVLLDATEGQYLESISFKRVLIFRFTAGTGLLLNASKGGAVTYSVSFLSSS